MLGNSDGIPYNWCQVKVHDVADVIMGNSPPGETYNDHGKGIPLINGPVEFSLEPLGYTQRTKYTTLPTRLCKTNDLLICVRGSTTGRTNVAAFDACIGRGVAAIRSRVDQSYMNQFIVSIRNDIFDSGSGSTFPSISENVINNIDIPLPPLPEQRRIVARIEALQARSQKAREALEAVGPLLEQFRQSVLAAAFRGDLTADWRAKHPNTEPASVLLERIRKERREKWETANLKKKYVEPEPVDESDLPELPEGWCWASLDELSGFITDGEHLSPETTDTGIPLLSAKDVREEGVIFDAIKHVSHSDAERFWNRCRPEKGDLLIVSRGATIGRSTILNVDQPFCLMGSVILAKLHDLTIANHVSHFMKSQFALKQLRSSSGASAQQAIYLRDVKHCLIPVAPAFEMQELSKRLFSAFCKMKPVVNDSESAQQTLIELNQSILAKAFRGELVSQDPNDEPATVLLERIRAEREAADKPVSKRKPRTPR